MNNLRLFDGKLFWTSLVEGDMAIHQVSVMGGTPVELARQPESKDSQGLPVFASRLAIDDQHVYWTGNGKILRVARSGGAPETVVTEAGVATDIAVDSARVYWAGSRGINAIAKP